MYMKNMKRRNGKYIQREGEDETDIPKKGTEQRRMYYL